MNYEIHREGDCQLPWKLYVAGVGTARLTRLGSYKSKRKALVVAALLAGRKAKITIIERIAA